MSFGERSLDPVETADGLMVVWVILTHTHVVNERLHTQIYTIEEFLIIKRLVHIFVGPGGDRPYSWFFLRA